MFSVIVARMCNFALLACTGLQLKKTARCRGGVSAVYRIELQQVGDIADFLKGEREREGDYYRKEGEKQEF